MESDWPDHFMVDFRFLTCLDNPDTLTLEDGGRIESPSDSNLVIGQDEWDGLLSPTDSLFLEYSFLAGLEASECVSLARGWQPRFLTVRERSTSRLVGAVPLYLKRHSDGEFIEEFDWVEEARSNGVCPWPRLFVGVPFTPHCGSRLIVASSITSEKRRVAIAWSMLRALVTIAKQGDVSLNVAFSEGSMEATLFEEAGFVCRPGKQAWWRNAKPVPHADFDAFLGTLRRKNAGMIMRQRQQLDDMTDICLEVVDGSTNPEAVTPELMAQVFDNCYLPTQLRNMDYVGVILDRNCADLNKQFFEYLAENFAHRILLVLARQVSDVDGSPGDVVGGSLCFAKDGRICGRYWGFPLEMEKRVSFLHFECCYHKLIEHAIERGYRRIEPGNGGSKSVFQVQRARGFEPQATPSYHFVPNETLRREISAWCDAARCHVPSWTKGKYSAYKGGEKPGSSSGDVTRT